MKPKRSLSIRRVGALGLTILVSCLHVDAAGQTIRYVDDSAPIGGDGSSWDTPYRHLQDALNEASTLGTHISEIRVAQGTHSPDETALAPTGSGNRSASFWIPDGIELNGGFAGFGAPDPNERDIPRYATVLDGDLLQDDQPNFGNRSDNSFHVLRCFNSHSMISGFTIRGGHANGTATDATGGGLRAQSSSIIVRDCLFESNDASTSSGACALISMASTTLDNCGFVGNKAANGGGIRIEAGMFHLRSCVFQNNLATSDGAGLRADNAKGSFVDCLFNNNSANGRGGGAFIQGINAIFRGCSFHDNSAASEGGGLRCVSTTITIDQCLFAKNSSTGSGGGLYAQGTASSEVIGCTFEHNTATFGAGMTDTSLFGFIRGCSFTQNTAAHRGGGIIIGGHFHEVVDCDFVGNATSNSGFGGGGGLWTDQEVSVRNSRFLGNTSQFQGGAFWGQNEPFTLQNCVLSSNTAGNRGGAAFILFPDYVEVLNCTVTNNTSGSTGGGFHIGGIDEDNVFEIKNCIVWQNADQNGSGQASQIYIDGMGQPIIQYSCIQNLGIVIGIGNIDDDPLFADLDGKDGIAGNLDDNLELTEGSPCIDAGGNFYFERCSLDAANAIRKFDLPAVPDTGGGGPPLPDIGAYEYFSPLQADCNTNGFIDDCDIDTISADCNANATPDECDIASGQSLDCNANGLPDECELARENDCNQNLIPDSCDIALGTASDCNANDVPDTCDILGGLSIDCNVNGKPDECDQDCDMNGIADDCDIANGTVADCDSNGVPDACDIALNSGLTYQLDDGAGEQQKSVSYEPDHMIWINQCTVAPGGEYVVAIDIAWGNIAWQTPTDLALWTDPNNDGDPNDAQLVFLLTIPTPHDAHPFSPPPVFSVPIPPTFVGTAGQSFFVGAHVFHNTGEMPGMADTNAPHQLKSWYAAGPDLRILGANPVPPKKVNLVWGSSFDWVLRARAGSSIDSDYNGIPDKCADVPGDVTGDGYVNVDDLLAVVNAWGNCLPPPAQCPADIAPKRGDGVVNVDDLLMVINHWDE